MCKTLNVVVMGCGWVGVTAAAVYAKWGHNVLGVDLDPDRVYTLLSDPHEGARGEPDLGDLILQGLQSKRLSFSSMVKGFTRWKDALRDADIIVIAVGTPTVEGKTDLSQVREAATTIGAHCSNNACVMIKSTVPVGTFDEIETIIDRGVRVRIPHATHCLAVASVPEFLAEGSAVSDFENPDRLVIGCDDDAGASIIEGDLYRCAARDIPVVCVSNREAELSKYACNAMLATRISFMNDLAMLCDRMGCDVKEVAKVIGGDHRIGPRFLEAGIGYGGSCFSKDITSLISQAHPHQVAMNVAYAARSTNDWMVRYAFDKVRALQNCDFEGCVVAVLGLTFKEGTSDVRDSRALDLARAFVNAGAVLRVYDAYLSHQAVVDLFLSTMGVGSNVFPCNTVQNACEDARVIVVPHAMEVDIEDLTRVAEKGAILLDARNVFEVGTLAGLTHVSIGRPTTTVLPKYKVERGAELRRRSCELRRPITHEGD